jgi:hypothetical protein
MKAVQRIVNLSNLVHAIPPGVKVGLLTLLWDRLVGFFVAALHGICVNDASVHTRSFQTTTVCEASATVSGSAKAA